MEPTSAVFLCVIILGQVGESFNILLSKCMARDAALESCCRNQKGNTFPFSTKNASYPNTM